MNDYNTDAHFDTLSNNEKALLRAICKQLNNTALQNEESQFWGGVRFFDFIYPDKKHAKQRVTFQDECSQCVGIKFATIEAVKKQSIKPETAQKAFCFAAHVQGVELEKFLAQFVAYCGEYPSHLSFTGHEDTIKELIDRYALENRWSESTGFKIQWHPAINPEEEPICEITACEGEKHLQIPNRSRECDFTNIATLFDPEYQLTALVGREKELAELWAWLESDSLANIALLYGDGGIGKTRLALELASQAESKGWAAGFGQPKLDGAWYRGKNGTLIIIDHPEERRNSIRQLLFALKTLPKELPLFRVLLMGRNQKTLDLLVSDVQDFVSLKLSLTPFKTPDEYKLLLRQAWGRIQQLKVPETDQPTSIPSVECYSQKFNNWMLKNKFQVSPLIIFALAFYLAETSGESEDDFIELTDADVLRFITEREVRLIIKEVKNYIGTQASAVNFTPEGVCLLRAVAAISGCITPNVLHEVVSDVSQQRPFHQPPALAQLQNLTLWKDQQLLPLKPDILATDFLMYCLHEFSKGEENKWILPALGLTRINNKSIDNKSIVKNFSRLGRMVFDAELQLKNNNISINSLANRIESNPAFCFWVASYLSSPFIEVPLKPIVVAAIHSRGSICKSIFKDSLSDEIYKMNFNTLSDNSVTNSLWEENRSVIEYCETSPNQDINLYLQEIIGGLKKISYELKQEQNVQETLKEIELQLNSGFDKFKGRTVEVAQLLGNIAVVYSIEGQGDMAIRTIRVAIQKLEASNNHGDESYLQTLLYCYKYLSCFYINTEDKPKTIATLQEIIVKVERLVLSNPATFGSVLAHFRFLLAGQLADIKDATNAKAIIEKVVVYYQRTFQWHSKQYSPELNKSLFLLSILLFENDEKIKAYQTIDKAIKYAKMEDGGATIKSQLALYGNFLLLTLFFEHENKSDEALSAILQALQILEQHTKVEDFLGNDSANKVTDKIIESLFLNQRYSQAILVLEKISRTLTRSSKLAPEKYSERCAMIDWSLAAFYREAGYHRRAYYYIRKSNEIFAKLNKNNPVKYLEYFTYNLHTLYKVSLDLHLYKKALETSLLTEKCFKSFMGSDSTMHRDFYAIHLGGMAEIYQKLDQPDKAIDLACRAEKALKLSAFHNIPFIKRERGINLTLIGSCYVDKKEYVKSNIYTQRAIEIYESLNDEVYKLDIAYAKLFQSVSMSSVGESEKAIRNIKATIKLLINSEVEKHPKGQFLLAACYWQITNAAFNNVDPTKDKQNWYFMIKGIVYDSKAIEILKPLKKTRYPKATYLYYGLRFRRVIFKYLPLLFRGALAFDKFFGIGKKNK